VIFDYIYSETLHDTTRGYGKSLARAGRMSGEPYVFGIGKGQVGAFLAERGFRDVLDASLEEVRAKYFTGRNAGRAVVTDAIAIASAKVVSIATTSRQAIFKRNQFTEEGEVRPPE